MGSCRPLGKRKLTPVIHLGAWNALSGGSPKFWRRNEYPRGERMPEQILWRGSVLPLEDDGAKAGIDRALGRRGAREARADDEDVGLRSRSTQALRDEARVAARVGLERQVVGRRARDDPLGPRVRQETRDGGGNVARVCPESPWTDPADVDRASRFRSKFMSQSKRRRSAS